ncbi:hypothetical protein B8A32_02210 [Loigolactobacillus backii]|uniref:protein rep n=1 Tax=Loigolactobacillus backii TaxID=375175 RepID=UPI000C686F65|nr:protein rep [Loigolactobacillus backii]PIO88289.1 hypothetical protein B8A32_02210 [Loigolactobacillus backii]
MQRKAHLLFLPAPRRVRGEFERELPLIYGVKLTQLAGLGRALIDDLEQALAGSRQISYGGLLKEIRKQLQLEDVENGDLINTDSDDQKVDQVVREIVAKWDYQRKNYFV